MALKPVKDPVRVAFGGWLKEERDRIGFTQAQLHEALEASGAKLSLQVVSQWENGWTSPADENAAAIAAVLGVEPAEVMRRLGREAVSSVAADLLRDNEPVRRRDFSALLARVEELERWRAETDQAVEFREAAAKPRGVRRRTP